MNTTRLVLSEVGCETHDPPHALVLPSLEGLPPPWGALFSLVAEACHPSWQAFWASALWCLSFSTVRGSNSNKTRVFFSHSSTPSRCYLPVRPSRPLPGALGESKLWPPFWTGDLKSHPSPGSLASALCELTFLSPVFSDPGGVDWGGVGTQNSRPGRLALHPCAQMACPRWAWNSAHPSFAKYIFFLPGYLVDPRDFLVSW